MVKEIQLRITLKEEERSDILVLKSALKLDIDQEDITGVKILRKSIDARKPKIILNYKVAVYIQEALPKLSFRDNEFDLALCSHYLFLYSDHISLDEHIASIKELCRVAKEVGIYPLLSLDGGLSPHFNAALPELEKVGLIAFLAEANYQFQKGATQMLVVKTM